MHVLQTVKFLYSQKMEKKRIIKLKLRFSGMIKFKFLSRYLLIRRNTFSELLVQVVSKLISVCHEPGELYYVHVVA